MEEDMCQNDFDLEMEMEMEMESLFDDQQDSTATPPAASQNTAPSSEAPVKIRKKPGRKPNPASPALRKAQNRAAQRAFRERKERHLRELETTVKQIRDQRDKLQTENDQLKSDSDTLRLENWYLKGVVLTLQLVCFRHNLVIPQHGPYLSEEALADLARARPEPIAAYMNANANNKPPIPLQMYSDSFRNTHRNQDRYLSTETIVFTKDPHPPVTQPDFGAVPESADKLSHPHPDTQAASMPFNASYLSENVIHPLQILPDQHTAINIPALSPVMDSKPYLSASCSQPPPCQEQPTIHHTSQTSDEHLASNLSAIQTLRLRLRMQYACNKSDRPTFTIQPTILQLAIPHDPRIDLIPTPHMRDRMILFRDLFDLDDCFRCLIGNSTFHGGDPAVAANWELLPSFFEKFWFLTIDYQPQRTNKKRNALQGTEQPVNKEGAYQKHPVDHTLAAEALRNIHPFASHDEQHNLVFHDMGGFLPSDYFAQSQGYIPAMGDSYASPASSRSNGSNHVTDITSSAITNTTTTTTATATTTTTTTMENNFFAPVPLTGGFAIPSTEKTDVESGTCQPWEVLLNGITNPGGHEGLPGGFISPTHL